MSTKYSGLKYIGHSKFGVSLMLFNSYTKVDVLPNAPYYFKPEDNQSDEAIEFYKRIRVSVGVELFSDSKDTTEKVVPEANSATEVATDKVTHTPEVDKDEAKEEVTKEAVSDTTNNELANLTDGELSEYLEMNYSTEYIKAMVSSVDSAIRIGRKSVSTLISDLIPSHKDEVVSYLLSHDNK